MASLAPASGSQNPRSFRFPSLRGSHVASFRGPRTLARAPFPPSPPHNPSSLKLSPRANAEALRAPLHPARVPPRAVDDEDPSGARTTRPRAPSPPRRERRPAGTPHPASSSAPATTGAFDDDTPVWRASARRASTLRSRAIQDAVDAAVASGGDARVPPAEEKETSGDEKEDHGARVPGGPGAAGTRTSSTFLPPPRRPQVVTDALARVPDPPKVPYERVYRHPDGSLRKERPPRKPVVVAARREWADLVHYARINGGNRDATEKGVCFRTGIGCTWAEHAEYLRRMGLEPETDPDGEWVGYDPEVSPNPLDDPEHPVYEILKVLDEEDLKLSPEERAEKAREFARECQRFSSVEKGEERESEEARARGEEARAREASEAASEAAASGE